MMLNSNRVPGLLELAIEGQRLAPPGPALRLLPTETDVQTSVQCSLPPAT